jgi:hypothetical protein
VYAVGCRLPVSVGALLLPTSSAAGRLHVLRPSSEGLVSNYAESDWVHSALANDLVVLVFVFARAVFSLERKKIRDTVALSFIYGNYCLTMN